MHVPCEGHRYRRLDHAILGNCPNAEAKCPNPVTVVRLHSNFDNHFNGNNRPATRPEMQSIMIGLSHRITSGVVMRMYCLFESSHKG